MNGISTANFRLQQSCYSSPQRTKSLGFKGDPNPEQEFDIWPKGKCPHKKNNIPDFQKTVLAKLADISESLKELKEAVKPDSSKSGSTSIDNSHNPPKLSSDAYYG